MCRSRYRLPPIALLLLIMLVEGQAPVPAVAQPIDQAKTALEPNRVATEVRACAAALKQDAMDAQAHACATSLLDKVQPLTAAGTALLGAGEVDDAHALCSALLVLNPANTDAQKCATASGARITARARERVKLAQISGLIERAEIAQAAKLLDEIATSDFLPHLDRARELQQRLDDRALAQLDASKRAEIARAHAMMSEGRRSEAETALAALISSGGSQSVMQEAGTMLSASRASWMTPFRDAVKSPWLIQGLAGLFTVGGLWLGLRVLRVAWCSASKRAATWLGQKRAWRFVGMGEDAVGARDAVLDAIRRVPHEVTQPIWTRTRLLLYPASQGWEVWEDFAVQENDRATPVHEPSFNMKLESGQANQMLAKAFQNLEFSVGAISMAGVARLWAGLVEWWQTGCPTVSGAAREVEVGSGTKHISVRLTASGCDTGTVSVLATTDVAEGVDAVAVSAERSAYKLLFRIGQHKDSAKQIDGHAAFRQGVTSFASCMQSVVDAESARNHRNAALIKTIANLAFARETFCGDPDHKVYYLEATRLEALAYACIGRDMAARKLLDELYDSCVSTTLRERQLAAESRYNQAMLYWKAAHSTPGSDCAAGFVASSLFDQVQAGGDSALAQAALVWQAADLASMTGREWLLLRKDAARKKLETVAELADSLAAAAKHAERSDRRRFELLSSHARQSVAIAQLRYLAAFELPGRGPFANGSRGISDSQLARVRAALESLSSSAQLALLSPSARTAAAYALLLESRWFDAEKTAIAAVTANKADQFALYVAAEAAVQRKDPATARKYLTELQQDPVTEAALSALRMELDYERNCALSRPVLAERHAG
jgi:hypothetical protein